MKRDWDGLDFLLCSLFVISLIMCLWTILNGPVITITI